MKTIVSLIVALGAAGLASAAATSSAESDLQVAFKFRMDLARAVAGGEGPDADAAEEALAMGHHLLGLARPEAAEVFFRAAEAAFARASLTERDNRTKAGYLVKLATVRASYLGKAQQAKADIDEAIRLQPADKALQHQRALLARGRAETFKPAVKQ